MDTLAAFILFFTITIGLAYPPMFVVGGIALLLTYVIDNIIRERQL